MTMTDTMTAAASRARLEAMISGFQGAQVVIAAAELDVAGKLAGGPLSVDELAAQVGADPAALARLTRALVALGLCAEDDGGRVSLTETGAWLRDDAPTSLRPSARVAGINYRAWGELATSVRTGKPSYPTIYGYSPREFMATQSELSAAFDAAMTVMSERGTPALLDAYDFSDVRLIADIGGGQGAFIAAVLVRYPTMRGILLDLPRVVAGASTVLQAAGVADRCRVEGGSFLDSVPAGADCYVLKGIVTNWNDAQVVRLLRNIRDGITPDGRLLIISGVTPSRQLPPGLAVLDLQWLVLEEGTRYRSADEAAPLFERAGFRLTNIIPVPGPDLRPIVEVRPV
jgi:SAM-dependent methyltransferase